MKAATKAKRRKRGRPMMNVAREPSGRVSRSGIDHGPADIIALKARVRHTGLPIDLAKDQKASSFIGYLSLIGPRDGISGNQYDAAVEYRDLRNAYLRAIKAPGAEYDSQVAGASEGEISQAYEDWCDRTIKTYGECRKAIQEAQNASRENLWAALDLVIIQDQRLHHMIGSTRILCNAMAKFFRI